MFTHPTRHTDPILGLDTTGIDLGVAICARGGIEFSRTDLSGATQSRMLVGLLTELLEVSGLSVRDLAAIAVNTGPGSFTGLRVGVAAALGLARALAIPAIGVDTFAAHAAVLGCHDAVTAVIVKAPRDEVFAGLRSWTQDGGWTPIGTDLSGPPATVLTEFAERLAGRTAVWTGNGVAALSSEIFRIIGLNGMGAPLEVPEPLALGVARAGGELAESGRYSTSIMPNYIRPAEVGHRNPDATA